MAQNYTWSAYTPLDSTSNYYSVFKSAYKNVRFTLDLEKTIYLTQADAYNLPGLSYKLYGVVDFWRILLAYNGLNDGIQDIQAGMLFNIPTKSSIVAYLTQSQSNNNQTILI